MTCGDAFQIGNYYMFLKNEDDFLIINRIINRYCFPKVICSPDGKNTIPSCPINLILSQNGCYRSNVKQNIKPAA